MMKVVFIKPPIPYHLNPKEQQPLGLLCIASSVRSKGYDVGLVDLGDKKIEESINFVPKADVYAFTSTFLDLFICHKLAKLLKKKYPDSKLIIGGTGPTATPEYIDPKVFDSMIIREGELSMLDCLNDIKGNKKLKTSYARPLMSEEELNKLPFPARDLLDCQGGPIFNFGKEYIEGESTGIEASRGCPFDCAFCASKNIWQRKIRFRSIENIVAEMKEVIEKLNIRKFKFQDDTFTLVEDRVINLCKEIEKLHKKHKIAWRCYGRVDLVTERMLKALKKAGCREIDFGIESGDQDILDLMNKKTIIERGIEAINLVRKSGLDSRAFMMVGLPGTTQKTADRDIDFIKKAKPDAINLAIYTPYPGSDIWDNPRKYDVEIIDKPKDYTELYKLNKYNMHLFSNDPNRTTKSFIKIKGLSSRELEKIKQKVIDYVISNKLLHYIEKK